MSVFLALLSMALCVLWVIDRESAQGAATKQVAAPREQVSVAALG